MRRSSGGYSKTRKKRSYGERQKKIKRRWRILLVLMLLLFGFLVINSFFLTTFRVSTTAMEPEIPVNSRIFAWKTYGGNFPFTSNRWGGFRLPERGDVVVLRPPAIEPDSWFVRLFDPLVRFFTLQHFSMAGNPLSEEPGTALLRVIGIPGDEIRMEDFIFYIRPQGAEFFLTEFEHSSAIYDPIAPDLPEAWQTSFPLSGYQEVLVVPEGEYYLAPDNRSVTSDSRYWGTLPIEPLEFRATLVYWPFTELHRIR